MAYSPKTGLKGIKSTDTSKKDITKLGKKAVDLKTAQPYFINLEHKFPDAKDAKATAPLFIFGKLAKVKAEIKGLKGAEHSRGMAYVTVDEKGRTCLNLIPAVGKAHNKEALIKKAMKETFTSAFADFKIGAEMSETEADKLAEAAEQLEDIADDEVGSDAAEATPDKKEEDKKDDGGAAGLIKDVADFLKGKAKEVVANVKAKSTTDGDKSAIEEVSGKVDQLKKLWETLSDEVKVPLAKGFEQVSAQFSGLEKIREALKGNTKIDDNDLDAFLKKINGEVDKIGANLDKAVASAASASSAPLPGGADLLKNI